MAHHDGQTTPTGREKTAHLVGGEAAAAAGAQDGGAEGVFGRGVRLAEVSAAWAQGRGEQLRGRQAVEPALRRRHVEHDRVLVALAARAQPVEDLIVEAAVLFDHLLDHAWRDAQPAVEDL